jgi:Putative beta barrel porin-7 (BBP7)
MEWLGSILYWQEEHVCTLKFAWSNIHGAAAEHGPSAGGEKSMRMLSGKHWLTVGLALLVSAQGFGTNNAGAQPPMMSDAPTSMAFPGPAPAGCDTYVDDGQGMFGTGVLKGPFGSRFGGHYESACQMGNCPDGSGGARGRGDGGLLSGGLCSGGACGGGLGSRLSGMSGESSLFSGRVLRLLGPLAPYADGSGSQRWFDFYGGTIAFARKSNHGNIGSTQQVFETGQFLTTDVISSDGQGTPAVPGTAGPPPVPGQVAQPGPAALRVSSLDLDKVRYGLELIGNIQTGPGANVEVRYFGLNDWSDTRSARRNTPTLFSVFSQWGTNPGGLPAVAGFDDTDRSFVHTISYNSKFDNAEVNYRRRWIAPNPAIQGSWLGGFRYFELDEKFGFSAIGSRDNTLNFNQLRFFNMDTKTKNHLVGFQIGGDLWANIVPGISIGTELKGGVYNNHVDVESVVVSNSVQRASENLSKDTAAFLVESSVQGIYRLTYSWTLRGAYNFMYVDKIALAPNNFNPRLTTTVAPTPTIQDFGANRAPFINTSGHALYHGFSFGAEFLW